MRLPTISSSMLNLITTKFDFGIMISFFQDSILAITVNIVYNITRIFRWKEKYEGVSRMSSQNDLCGPESHPDEEMSNSQQEETTAPQHKLLLNRRLFGTMRHGTVLRESTSPFSPTSHYKLVNPQQWQSSRCLRRINGQRDTGYAMD
jgi:hypothetical protein